MVALVSECIDLALKKVLVSEELRLEVCMDACDEILRRINKKERVVAQHITDFENKVYQYLKTKVTMYCVTGIQTFLYNVKVDTQAYVL